MSPVEAYHTNTLMIQRMTQLLDKIGYDNLQHLIEKDGAMADVFDLLTKTWA